MKNDYIFSKKSTEEKVLYKKEDLSLIYTEGQKEFLINFYNERANSEDGYILDIVLFQQELLKNQNFSTEEYYQISSILLASEQSIFVLDGITQEDINYEEKFSFSSKSSDDGFWACMRRKAGRAIGEGIVQGALFGAIGGWIADANGGTLVIPFIGTATGAVGGAVFGAAGGAVLCALGGAFWTARSCGGGRALKTWIEKAKRL
jgi:hypothetical protein